MIEEVTVPLGNTLEEYAANAMLTQKVHELSVEAATLVPRLGGTVIMVNSTARGGGVAEMLPHDVSLLRQLGLKVRWLVTTPENAEFFVFTKRLHNLIHGQGQAEITSSEVELYERVSRDLALELSAVIAPGDLVIIHDPQPLGLGKYLRELVPGPLVWRCHIGLDQRTRASDCAWHFLRRFADAYARCVFSAPEYIPSFLASRSTVISPGIDPLTHKNRLLTPHKMMGILCDAGLQRTQHPLVADPFHEPVHRLGADGVFRTLNEDFGWFYRPTLVQISRWDRLKGFLELLKGFQQLKAQDVAQLPPAPDWHERSERRRRACRLVLAGPDPMAVQDDPEALEVLSELRERYRELPAAIQRDVALLSLPMGDAKDNALIVNVLQSTAFAVAQNSLQEGFGLTATEAMWKRVPVMGSYACGLRRQIRPGLDGLLVEDPSDPECVRLRLAEMLASSQRAESMGRSAQRRVWDEFLIFNRLALWMRLIGRVAQA